MTDRSPIQNKVCKVLMGFHGQLFKFTQVMLSISKFGLPERIEASHESFEVLVVFVFPRIIIIQTQLFN